MIGSINKVPNFFVVVVKFWQEKEERHTQIVLKMKRTHNYRCRDKQESHSNYFRLINIKTFKTDNFLEKYEH